MSELFSIEKLDMVRYFLPKPEKYHRFGTKNVEKMNSIPATPLVSHTSHVITTVNQRRRTVNAEPQRKKRTKKKGESYTRKK